VRCQNRGQSSPSARGPRIGCPRGSERLDLDLGRDAGDRRLHGKLHHPAARARAGDDEREAARVAVDDVHTLSAVGDRQDWLVAPRGEHVVAGEREQGPLALLECTGLIVVLGSGRHNDRLALLVEQRHAHGRIEHIGVERHQHVQRQRLGLRCDGSVLGAVVAQPHIAHARRTVTHASAVVSRGLLTNLATEGDLQVAVGHVARIADAHDLASLEQHCAMADARDRTHVVSDEDHRAPFLAHPVEDVEALLLE
jgi:hypothetical protein